MKSLKKTTFLEAVAAAIEHEVKSFNFFLDLSNNLKNGATKELFQQLAEDGDKHIEFIKEIYKSAEGQELPNLKTLSQIHKFHSSTIQLLMDKLERNMNQEIGGDDRKALELAVMHGDDAIRFYSKMKDKFPDPKINLLFQKLLGFIETNTNLIEAQIMALEQTTPIDGQFFWEDESLMAEAAMASGLGKSSKKSDKKISSKQTKKKDSKPKPQSKTASKKKAVKSAKKKSVKKSVKKTNKKSGAKKKKK
jgi:rubrerythrin